MQLKITFNCIFACFCVTLLLLDRGEAKQSKAEQSGRERNKKNISGLLSTAFPAEGSKKFCDSHMPFMNNFNLHNSDTRFLFSFNFVYQNSLTNSNSEAKARLKISLVRKALVNK